jgi:hypothetical protein
VSRLIVLLVALALALAACDEPAASPSSPPPSPGCDASNAYVVSGKVPPTWAPAGKVTLSIAGHAITGEDVVDAAGKTVAHDSKKTPLARHALDTFPAEWICKVGAIGVVDEQESSADVELARPDGGKVVFDVVSPRAPDEASDLAVMCHEPPPAAPDLTPLQRFVAMHYVAQWLTTGHYRALTHAVDVAIANAPTKEARRNVARAAAGTIDADLRAHGHDEGSCAYSTILRAIASTP